MHFHNVHGTLHSRLSHEILDVKALVLIFCSMAALRVLHMSNTSRTLDNIPPTLEDLDNLQVCLPHFIKKLHLVKIKLRVILID